MAVTVLQIICYKCRMYSSLGYAKKIKVVAPLLLEKGRFWRRSRLHDDKSGEGTALSMGLSTNLSRSREDGEKNHSLEFTCLNFGLVTFAMPKNLWKCTSRCIQAHDPTTQSQMCRCIETYKRLRLHPSLRRSRFMAVIVSFPKVFDSRHFHGFG